MSRNGTGTYTLPQPPFVPNTTILSAAVNSDLSDIAAALTGSVSSDGQTPITGPLKAASGSAAAPGYSFSSGPTSGFYLGAGGSVVGAVNGTAAATLTASGWSATLGSTPVGAVADFAGSTAPSGWLLCFGQAVSQTTYAALFGVIAFTYGNPGGGNFNLPDCRGRTTYGQDNMGGSAASRITVAGGNFDGTVLGGTGGQQNKAILQTHLPSVNLPVSSITINDPGHTHASAGNQFMATGGFQSGTSGGQQYGNPFSNTASNTTGITLGGNVPTGGSGTVLPTLSNAIIFNKIIFVGV